MSLTADTTSSAANAADLRDSDTYFQLEQVFSQLDSPQQQAAPDWQQLADSAEQLLTRSTDLRVACWRAFALLRLRRPEPLVLAMGQLAVFINSAWHNCLPTRERGKFAALQWLYSALSRELDASPQMADELATLQAAACQISTALQAYSAERSHDWKQLASRLQAGPSEPPTNPTPVVRAPSKPVSDPTFSGPVDTDRQAQQQLRRLQEAAAPLLDWWLTQPERRACAVALSRSLTWAGIYQVPQHDNKQHTNLRPPPAERLSHCESLWQQSAHSALLQDLETSLRKAPFWLDGHFLAARCCDALADSQAAASIRGQTRLLLQRLPMLEQLCFDDGTPFATQATRRWLTAAATPDPDSTAPKSTDTKDLLTLLHNDGFGAAAKTLAQRMQTQNGERQRAVGRLQLAKLLLADGQSDQARDLLEPQLSQLQHSMPLALWDQQLLSDTLDLLQQSLADQRDESSRQRRRTLQQQLRWLNLEHTLDQAARPAQHGET